LGNIGGRRSLENKTNSTRKETETVDNFYTIITGPNGCGKSTQGKKLANFLPEAIHTDMSTLISQKIRQDEYFRNEYAETLAKGDLLPCNVVNELFREHSERIQYKSHILTGFPRTVAQAISFMRYLNTKYGDGYAIDHVTVFELQMTVQDAIERTRKRIEEALLAGEKVRKDDGNQQGEINLEGIKRRYSIYENDTTPALDFFRPMYIPIVQIDATLKIHEILAKILTVANQRQGICS
jgi:adenylate kinase family enzyme